MDDYHTGDSICMQCGLVLERLLGGGSGLETFRGRGPECQPTPDDSRDDDDALAIADLLHFFGVEGNGEAEEIAHRIFARIYAKREERVGFRKTREKRNIALAFALANALTESGSPRPLDDIAVACGVSCRKVLLDLPRYLNFSPDELLYLKVDEYELQDPRPSDYVDVLCANLGIPFAVASQVREEIESDQVLCGRQPLVICAAVLERVLRARGQLVDGQRKKAICALARCQPRSVTSAVRLLDEHHGEGKGRVHHDGGARSLQLINAPPHRINGNEAGWTSGTIRKERVSHRQSSPSL